MATATITISDNPTTGQLDLAVDYGAEHDQSSQAHQMADQLITAVLSTAKSYTKVEDTVPGVDVEPAPQIITPTNQN